MGLFGKAKEWVARHEAEALGKKFAKEKNPMLEWLKRNKAVSGLLVAAVAAVTTWATAGCAPVYDKDVLGILHVNCGTVVFLLGLVAAWLTGAGVMTSDKHEAVKQGYVAPAGPPATPPPAEVKRIIEEERKG